MKSIFVIVAFFASTAWGHAQHGDEDINHLLEDGKARIDFRLFSAADSSLCLYQHTEGERVVLKWSQDCGTDASVLSYVDGGGYTSLFLNNEQYAMFVIKPNLPKTWETEMIAKNMFPANTIEQKEFVNGLSADLYEQKDGTFIIANFDEEEPAPPSICIGSENSSDANILNSARLLEVKDGDLSKCARLVLKEKK